MSFEQFVEQAWKDHATQTEAVAARLRERSVGAQEEIPRLAALITHVFGEHLGNWEEGLALLERMQTQADSAENRNTLFRNISALRLAGGFSDNVEDLLDSDQIRVLCVAAAALVGQKQIARAQAYFHDALALAEQGLADDDPALRALAVTANNIAADLETQRERTPAETELMVRAARSALKNWKQVGEWPQRQAAHYRLSKSLHAAGQMVEALEEAMACLAMCKAHGAGAFDLFWANEAVATVVRDSKPSAFTDYVNQMRKHLVTLAPEEKAMCEARLREFAQS